jgi:DNA gyrase inhibitor GyrI
MLGANLGVIICCWRCRLNYLEKSGVFGSTLKFINSPDIAAHCREINHQFTTFEMAVIIWRSKRNMADKHAAWRAIITDYPDTPTPKNMHYDSFDSTHEKLKEVIADDERRLALFKLTEPGAVYLQERSDSVFTNFEKLWADVLENWERDEAPEIKVRKILTDDLGWMEAYLGYDGAVNSVCGGYYKIAHDENKLDFSLFYIDYGVVECMFIEEFMGKYPMII